MKFIYRPAFVSRMPQDADTGVGTLPVFYLWAGIGAIAGYLLRLLFASTMTPDQYGSFYAVIGLVSFAVIFNDLGLSQGLAFYFVKWRKNANRGRSLFTFILLLKLAIAFILGALLAVFHKQIATEYLHSPSLANPLLLFSAFFVFEGFISLANGYYLATKRVWLYASIGQMRTLLTLALSAIAYLLFGSMNLLTVYFLAWFAGVAATAIVYAFPIPFIRLVQRRLSLSLARPVLHYSGLLFLTGVSGVLLCNLDVVMIAYFRAPVEVGFYQIALPIATLFLVVIDPLNSFLSSFVLHRHHERKITLAPAFSLIYGTGAFLLFPFTLFLALFSKEVILVMFGDAYVAAAPALILLGAAFFFKGFYSINTVFLYNTGKPKVTMIATAIGVTANFLLNLFLIPKYGFVGAAWATLVSFFLMMLLTLAAVRRTTPFPFPWMNWLKTILISCLLVLGTVALKNALSLNIYAEAAVIAAFFFLGYLGLGLLFRVVDWRELLRVVRSLVPDLRSWFSR